jgi:hypothetical protein
MIGVNCEEYVPDISTPKQKHVGVFLIRKILRQADGRRIAKRIEIRDKVDPGRGEHACEFGNFSSLLKPIRFPSQTER